MRSKGEYFSADTELYTDEIPKETCSSKTGQGSGTHCLTYSEIQWSGDSSDGARHVQIRVLCSGQEEQMKTHEETLRTVCDYLNRHAVSYVVVGGLAVMYHGVPRTTVDIDFILRLDRLQSESLVSFLESVGFSVSLQDMLTAFSEHSHCTVLALDSPLRIDIQGVYSEFDRLTLERAVDVELAGTRVRLGSIEDTLVNKILFGSEQDLRDALGIYLRHSDSLDYAYVDRMCQLLTITRKWGRFLSAAKRKLHDESHPQ